MRIGNVLSRRWLGADGGGPGASSISMLFDAATADRGEVRRTLRRLRGGRRTRRGHARQDARRPGAPGRADGGGRSRASATKPRPSIGGEIVGLSSYPTDESRLRYFGGTSGHWEGKCRDAGRGRLPDTAWVPMSGWPIGSADLDPFQAEAAAILDLKSPTEPLDIGDQAGRERAFAQFNWRWSPPTRFGDKYRDGLDRLRARSPSASRPI